MAKIPSIELIPSACKSGKVYSVLPTDGSGDLNFARASEATRVNKDGLIEKVGSNVPRIDYTDGGCPKLLLEPQSRNLITHSEDFTNASWVEENSSITDNSIISPNGTLNADKLIESADVNFHRISYVASVSDATHSVSVFVKKAERNYFVIRTNISGTNVNTCFDLNDGSVVYDGHLSSSIFNYEDDWYRCVITQTSPIITTRTIGFLISDNVVTNNNIPSYQGDGTSGVYLWGAQLEQGSYATSYIPTSGATATRNAETASKSNISNLINSSEGVLYLNTAALADSGVSRNITIYQNTSNLIKFIYSSASNRVDFVAVSGGSLSCNLTKVLSNTIEFSKIALKWKTNDFALWINGVEEATDTSGNSPLGMDKLNFTNEIGILPFYANVKDLRIYNKALTDAELKALTS